MWLVWGERFETADLSSNQRVFQPVTFNKNIVLKACKTWFIINGNPTYTNVYMEIWSNENNAPKRLLYTSSNVVTKTTLCDENNGVREAYFDFDMLPTFQENDIYHFVPRATGYTGAQASHLAWKKSYPDPVYKTGIDSSYTSLLISPYDIYFIGADL